MIVQNLEEMMVTSADQVFKLLRTATSNRKTAETLMNKTSSRSHSIFNLTVHTKEFNTDGEDVVRTGRLSIVDLAGSECIGKSGAKDTRAAEAGKINKVSTNEFMLFISITKVNLVKIIYILH